MSKEFEEQLKYEEHSEIMLIKDRYKDNTDSTFTIKTHLSCKRGIVGFYTASELIKYYGECNSTIISYEKDYGFNEEKGNMIVIRNYLLIDSDIDYDKEIEVDRLCK